MEAYREAMVLGARVNPMASAAAMVDAREGSGFLQGWQDADEMKKRTLEILERW